MLMYLPYFSPLTSKLLLSQRNKYVTSFIRTSTLQLWSRKDLASIFLQELCDAVLAVVREAGDDVYVGSCFQGFGE